MLIKVKYYLNILFKAIDTKLLKIVIAEVSPLGCFSGFPISPDLYPLSYTSSDLHQLFAATLLLLICSGKDLLSGSSYLPYKLYLFCMRLSRKIPGYLQLQTLCSSLKPCRKHPSITDMIYYAMSQKSYELLVRAIDHEINLEL